MRSFLKICQGHILDVRGGNKQLRQDQSLLLFKRVRRQRLLLQCLFLELEAVVLQILYNIALTHIMAACA